MAGETLFPIDFTDAEWEAVITEQAQFGISRDRAMRNARDRRYDPRQDAEFMAELPARLEAWRATRKGPTQ